jgi:hypothetical protein
MRIVRRILLAVGVLVLLAAVWVWWNRYQKVDMAAYVPAETLVYLEANSLPDITSAVTTTDAWKALAAPAGIKPSMGELGWLSRLAMWTGVGPAEAVVFSRAQVAVAVLGFDAADAGETLKVKPRYAVVIETHTSSARARAAVEKRVGDFARRAYTDPRVERRQMDGSALVVWSSPNGDRRIMAAITESVAVIGNDETTVRTCLAVRRGERQSLAGDAQLEAMRERVAGHGALAFGYVSPAGAARLLEVGATLYAGRFLEDPRAQGAMAATLPQLASKILGSLGWSARMTGGILEDRYFLSLPSGVTARLRDPLIPPDTMSAGASEFLPADTFSLSRYNLRDPEAAWRGLNGALISQLDTLGAFIVSQFMEVALKPYRIDQPDTFLRAVGSEIVTARLDNSGASTVTIVQARDEKSLRELIQRRLGAGSKTERVGEAELLIAAEEERGAAAFLDGRLLMGAATDVRRCLEARTKGATLNQSTAFKEAGRLASMNSPANVVTYTDDRESARTFITAIASQRGASGQPFSETELERALGQMPFAVSATRLIEGGFERTTRSSFGQFGTLAAQFAPASSSTTTP